MGKIKDMTGKKVGMLTYVKYVGKDKHNKTIWLAKCDCGGEMIIRQNALVRGYPMSCGCKDNRGKGKQSIQFNFKEDKKKRTCRRCGKEIQNANRFFCGACFTAINHRDDVGFVTYQCHV